MSFVGGLTRPEVERALAPLTEKWEATAVSIPLIDGNAARPAAKVFFADYPGARQSYVIVGSKAMPIADPDAYPAVIVNDKLGESAGSLLFEILRLQHGYTYGAYSGFSQGNLINTFQAWSSVQATVTRESLTLLRDILKNYGTDYSQQWLDHSKEAMLRTMNGALETPNAQLNMLRTIVLFGLPDDYVKQRENTLKTFTLDQAKTVIGKYLNFDDMTVVVVGDAKTQLEGVKSLGLGDPVLVDFSGRPIR